MSRIHAMVGVALAVTFGMVACDGQPNPVAPGSAAGTTGTVETVGTVGTAGSDLDAKATIDLNGTWQWDEHSKYNMTAFAAQLFGLVPEGPRTRATCHSWGEVTLNQIGDTFTGSATQQSDCQTRGGQSFGGGPFAASLPVIDGKIHGRHASFTFVSSPPPVPCLYSVSIDVEGGTAVELSGTGRCIEPGHPQSPLPVPPPRIAPSKIISWVATR